MAYTSISCIGIDPLIAGLACVASGQLEILKDNLTNLKKYAFLQKHLSQHKALNILIKKCLHDHNAIIM